MVLNSDANFNPASGELDVWHINTINARDNIFFTFIVANNSKGIPTKYVIIDNPEVGEEIFDGSKKDCRPGLVTKIVVSGSSQNDVIDLTNVTGRDYTQLAPGATGVNGFEGNDTIRLGDTGQYAEGGEGNDDITGGSGDDEIYGGGGSDNIKGGAGDDYIEVGDGGNGFVAGKNVVQGGPGNDTIYGGNTPSELYGDSDKPDDARGGNDYVHGGYFGDSLFGGAGSDTLYGSPRKDIIQGNAGDDDIVCDTLNNGDIVDGGTGNNWIEDVSQPNVWPNDYGKPEGNHPAVDGLTAVDGAGNQIDSIEQGKTFWLKLDKAWIPDPDVGEKGTAVTAYLDTTDGQNPPGPPDGKFQQGQFGDTALASDKVDTKALQLGPGKYTFFAIASVNITSEERKVEFQGNFAEVTVTVTAPKVKVKPKANQGGELMNSPPTGFIVSRDVSTDNALTVNYSLTGSAIEGMDYAMLSGSVAIPAGALDAPIDVKPLDDGDGDDGQASENVVATLTPDPNVYDIDPTSPSATVTIDEETPPTVTITGSGAAVEKGLSGQFTVSRTGPVDSSLTVSLASGGTAQAGVDYQSLPASVTIPAGSRTAPVVVNALDDGTSGDLSPENVTETIQPSSAYNIGSPSSASVPIEEEGYTTVTIAATTAGTTEGSSAPGVFTVTRAAPYTQALTVSYTTGGSAINGVDYQSLSGTVTIPAGAPTAPIYVAPLDDGDGDDNLTSEAVVATLQPGAGYQVGTPASDTVTINEEAKTTVTIAATANANETSGAPGSFTVTRTGPTTAALSVTFSLGGSAAAGVDYSSPGTSVTIPAGQASATITIAPIDDGQTETSKTVSATLVDEPGVYAVGIPSAAQIGIDEDGTETVNVSATVPSTQETGNVPGVITVTRTGPITSSLTVNYQTQGTAQSGVDYQFLSGSVTIPAGQVSAEIDIVPLDDESQSDESLGDVAGLQLTYGSGYTIGNQSSASVTIVEDAPPTITVTPAVPVAVENGANGEFVARRARLAENVERRSRERRWNIDRAPPTMARSDELSSSIGQQLPLGRAGCRAKE